MLSKSLSFIVITAFGEVGVGVDDVIKMYQKFYGVLGNDRKKNIKVLIEYRDEKTNYTPQIIYNE